MLPTYTLLLCRSKHVLVATEALKNVPFGFRISDFGFRAGTVDFVLRVQETNRVIPYYRPVPLTASCQVGGVY